MGEIAVSGLAPPTPLTADRDLASFDSGEPSLDEWLKRRALQSQASGASRCFVLAADMNVIGYYSLSAGAIRREAAPGKLRRNAPDPLPVLLLGRLAVDRQHHNKGLGNALLRDALLRALVIGQDIGIVALLVHALHDQARQFYLSRGFEPSPLQPMTLLMTLATARLILTE